MCNQISSIILDEKATSWPKYLFKSKYMCVLSNYTKLERLSSLLLGFYPNTCVNIMHIDISVCPYLCHFPILNAWFQP